MGPTCGIVLNSVPTNEQLNAVDDFLARVAGEIERSRKGRVWDVWIDNRPVHVAVVASPARIELSAGCKAAEDYTILQNLAKGLAAILNGEVSELEE